VRKAREHKKKWEAILFWGGRSFTPGSGTTEPQGTCGGMVEYIQSNRLDVGGHVLASDAFDLFLMKAMQFGSRNKILFASPMVVYNMAKWNRTGMGQYYESPGPSEGKIYGVTIDAFISGAYGYRIPVIVKKEWGEFPTDLSTPSNPTGYGSYAFLIDMDYVVQRPLRDRDTKLITEQQPKGKDTYSAEYMREASFQVSHERAHGIVTGVTSTG